MQFPLRSTLACVAAWMACLPSQAMSLGPLSNHTLLGQPLNVEVALALESAQEELPECVTAEVHAGDLKLSRSNVQTLVESRRDSAAVVRVSTQTRIDEPFVTLILSVGCPVRLSRSYVIFVDPPEFRAVVPAQAELPVAPEASPRAVTADPMGLSSTPGSSSIGAPADRLTNASAQRGQGPGQAAARKATPRKTKVADGRPNPGRSSSAEGERAGKSSAPGSKEAAVGKGRAVSAEPPKPRLSLEPAQILTTAASAPSLASGTASAPEPSLPALAASQAVALDQAQQRIRVLEQELAQTKSDLSTLRAKVTPPTKDTVVEENAQTKVLVIALIASILLMGAVILWLWRRQRSERGDWWSPSVLAEPGVGATDEPDSPPAYSDSPALRSSVDPAAAQAVSAELTPEPPHHRSASQILNGLRVISSPPQAQNLVFAEELSGSRVSDRPSSLQVNSSELGEAAKVESQPAASLNLLELDIPLAASGPLQGTLESAASAPNRLSVDEILDLEQQADFFLLLGQDNDALELLNAQIEGGGCTSPLPYMKLLEVHRLRGEEQQFSEIGSRFSQRFGQAGPSWEWVDRQNRSLDEYPQQMQELASHWASPSRALSWLETMIFPEPSRSEVVDAPAYADLLLLYLVARDLGGDALNDSGVSAAASGSVADVASHTQPIPVHPGAHSSVDIDLESNP